MSELVHLNVGGLLHLTTRATLTRYPDSMLGAMFSNGLPTTKDANGHYFIDRDGSVFRHILNFLRSSQLTLPTDFTEFDLLSSEADFYQIQPLIDAIEKFKSHSDSQLMKDGYMLEVVEVRTGSTATMPTRNSRIKTILIGNKYILQRLPEGVLPDSQLEKLQILKDGDYTEVEVAKSVMRVKLADFLYNSGCHLVSSSMSSSSGHDNNELVSSILITEHSYRDVWYLSTSTVHNRQPLTSQGPNWFHGVEMHEGD